MNKGIDDAAWVAPPDNELLPITAATRMRPPRGLTPEQLSAWLEWRQRFEAEWAEAIRQEQRGEWPCGG